MYQQYSQNKVVYKSDWGKIGTAGYICMLEDILSKIEVPFQQLQINLDKFVLRWVFQVVTEPDLVAVCPKYKFWFGTWNECERPCSRPVYENIVYT